MFEEGENKSLIGEYWRSFLSLKLVKHNCVN
jgi:hypothetical protein